MARVHNFSAGPAALPTSVLAEIADEMMDYRGCGMSVLEMSHRSSMYQQIIDDAEATLRRLLSIPDNYRVLFLQGGATLQFAGIPMNLMRRGRAGYVVTGNFANKAYKEAAKYGEAVLLASSEDTNFDRIPTMANINARIAAEAAGDGLDYVYICLHISKLRGLIDQRVFAVLAYKRIAFTERFRRIELRLNNIFAGCAYVSPKPCFVIKHGGKPV